MTPDRAAIVLRAGIGLIAPVAIAGGLLILAPAGTYLWLKGLHVVAVIAWIGGMAAVIDLLARGTAMAAGSDAAGVLIAMAERILRRVVNPAMVVVWGIGLWLAWEGSWFASGWLHVKLGLVSLLSGLHGWAARSVRLAARGEMRASARFCAIMNAMVGVSAIAAVLLAVVKPM